MIFPGFPDVLSFFQVEWEPWSYKLTVSSITKLSDSNLNELILSYIK